MMPNLLAISEKLDPKCWFAFARQSLHAAVTDAAASCTGVDLDGDAIREWRDLRILSNVIEGNVEQPDRLGYQIGKLEVVLAGDIIEHVSNPGLMLDGIRQRMAKKSVLIISTLNSFGVASWIKYARGRFREGSQHVMCFNPIALRQLLERHGYTVDKAFSCYQSRAYSQYGRAFRIFRALLHRFSRFGGTLLYECHLRNDP
jgi:2-polyprenyl-3-methyl-5-hydroxy-6-metoxy-1,4-benzoquinol methylase